VKVCDMWRAVWGVVKKCAEEMNYVRRLEGMTV